MIGERENNLENTEYGTLNMRSYDISGNEIDAFFDASDDLVFVLDKTVNQNKNNVLLVINPDGDKKWDEILSADYGVDLETVRPKQDNKYQKLDIEYSGLSVYENLIDAYDAGDDIDDLLRQLNVLRDSAVRHSALMRLNAANETIATTNITITKTKESIVSLNTRLKTLRSDVSKMRKEIGREPTKKSAAKILRAESQIDAVKEKIKRAEKRLESAQKRLEIATTDAELASNLLNQPELEMQKVVKNEPIAVAKKYEVQTIPVENKSKDENMDTNNIDEKKFDDENYTDIAAEDNDDKESNADEIKPLFDEDPEIIDEDISFKPISFDSPDLPEPVAESKMVERNTYGQKNTEPLPVLETLTPVRKDAPVVQEEEIKETENWEPINISGVQTPVLDEIPEVPVVEQSQIIDPDDINTEPKAESFNEPVKPVAPMIENENLVRPVSPAPVVDSNNVVEKASPAAPIAPVAPVVANYDDQKSGSKPTFLYYMLLLILICASVFALWLYQKNMGNTKPWFSVATSETAAVTSEPLPEQVIEQPIKSEPVVESDVFVDAVPTETVDPKAEEPVIAEPEPVEPMIINTVSAKVSAFAPVSDPEPVAEQPTDDSVVYAPIVNKPVYGAGSKYDEMFVYEEDQVPEDAVEYDEYDEVYEEPGFYEDATGNIVYDGENYGFVEEPQFIEDNGESYDNQNVMYDDTVFYDDYIYDPEEAAYQAGDDGYDEY